MVKVSGCDLCLRITKDRVCGSLFNITNNVFSIVPLDIKEKNVRTFYQIFIRNQVVKAKGMMDKMWLAGAVSAKYSI